jgi:LysM repeat protein
MQMPGRKYNSGAYRYGFNGQEKSDEIAEGLTTAMFWEYDSRIGRRWNTDPVFKEYESPYVCFNGNPILSNDILGDDAGDPDHPNDTHKIKKGETLSGISQKYGVSIKDLQTMNNIKYPDKIKAGNEIIVNPETNFLNSPYCDPVTNNGRNAQYVEEKNLNRISRVGFNFVTGEASENTVITQGSGLNMVQTSPVVRNLVGLGIQDLLADGKLVPRKVVIRTYAIGKIYQNNGRRIFMESIKRGLGLDDNENRGFYGAENILGSFDISMRVKADGYSIAICVYDSKTIRSFSDGNTPTTLRKLPMTKMRMSSTYQRYIWDMVLCAPGLNQKKR